MQIKVFYQLNFICLQFYLDMKFVICFASQGRYLSRILHRVVNEIISKAMAAFATTGMDPNRYYFNLIYFAVFGMCLYILAFLTLRVNITISVLPEDDWFNEVCQEAMERLSGKPKGINGERDLSSPTASVSAQSISSIRSHGSS